MRAAPGFSIHRGAVEEVCRALGLAVVTPVPDPPGVGKTSPPWGKDQKDAAALACAALRAGAGDPERH